MDSGSASPTQGLPAAKAVPNLRDSASLFGVPNVVMNLQANWRIFSYIHFLGEIDLFSWSLVLRGIWGNDVEEEI